METTNIREEVGKRIRTIRKAKGLTQEELGEKAGLHYKYIGEVERGEVNPSVETLVAVAKALDINISQLFTENWQLPIDCQLQPKDVQLIKEVLPFLSQILKIITGLKQLPTKEIQLIKNTLPFLGQLLELFSDLNKSFGGCKIKDLERIKKSLIPLNKLFLEEK